jgi:mitogen-activated protein kinase organizer 1
MVLSGSEDGRILVWDTIDSKVIYELWHDESMKTSQNSKRNIIGSVAECPARNEWASAGGDGTFYSYTLNDNH